MMIEAGGSENLFDLVAAGARRPDEELLAEGIEASKAPIAEAIALQLELAELVGKPKGTIAGDLPTIPCSPTTRTRSCSTCRGRSRRRGGAAVRIKSNRAPRPARRHRSRCDPAALER